MTVHGLADPTTTDPDETADVEEVFQLVYASRAAQPFTDAELVELLTRSRQKNDRLDVTGMLLYHDGSFIQALEGNRESHKFTLTNAHKDMRYLASMADAAGLSNPIGNAVKNSYALARATGGEGPEDYVPHLVDFIARANGLGE